MTELFNHIIEPNAISKAQFSAYNDNVSLSIKNKYIDIILILYFFFISL
jgi:hypothetical protein